MATMAANFNDKLQHLLMDAEKFTPGSQQRTESLEQIRSMLLDRRSAASPPPTPCPDLAVCRGNPFLLVAHYLLASPVESCRDVPPHPCCVALTLCCIRLQVLWQQKPSWERREPEIVGAGGFAPCPLCSRITTGRFNVNTHLLCVETTKGLKSMTRSRNVHPFCRVHRDSPQTTSSSKTSTVKTHLPICRDPLICILMPGETLGTRSGILSVA